MPEQSGLKSGRAAVPSVGYSRIPIEHNVAWAEAYIRTKCYPDASSRLAQQTRAESGGVLCPFRVELGPHLIQFGLGRGLPPYQVAS